MADSLGGAVTFVLAKCLVTHVVAHMCENIDKHADDHSYSN